CRQGVSKAITTRVTDALQGSVNFGTPWAQLEGISRHRIVDQQVNPKQLTW
ncbi:hypothetical protein Pmar_PMAR026788, partial [Perkinsus marinus ATCC 50983]